MKNNYWSFLHLKILYITTYRYTSQMSTLSSIIMNKEWYFCFIHRNCDLLLCISRCLCKENGVRNKALHSSHWKGLSSEWVCKSSIKSGGSKISWALQLLELMFTMFKCKRCWGVAFGAMTKTLGGCLA